MTQHTKVVCFFLFYFFIFEHIYTLKDTMYSPNTAEPILMRNIPKDAVW